VFSEHYKLAIMSSESQPITPAAFAEALKDLGLSSLHLKVLELRNSIAHLDYSNEQLRPFAEGVIPIDSAATATGRTTTATTEPDQDCIDAIRENEAVITRMQERIALVRAEVEARGASWNEFRSPAEVRSDAESAARQEGRDGSAGAAANGASSTSQLPNGPIRGQDGPWADGTFTTGRISNGNVVFDQTSGGRTGSGAGTAASRQLTDEELRRRLEERLGNLDDDDEPAEGEEGGMHL
jgi:hypothetical protein